MLFHKRYNWEIEVCLYYCRPLSNPWLKQTEFLQFAENQRIVFTFSNYRTFVTPWSQNVIADGTFITLGSYYYTCAICSVFKLQVTDTLSVSPSGDIFWRGHEKSCGAAEKNRGCKSLYSFSEVLTIVSFYVYTVPFYFLLSRAIYNVLRLPLGVSKICVTQKFRRSWDESQLRIRTFKSHFVCIIICVLFSCNRWSDCIWFSSIHFFIVLTDIRNLYR